MSFHGGLLGVVAGVVGFSLKNGLPILGVGDAVAAAAPIGLFFGRIANFINGELWGRPSTAPWAVIFPGEAAQACPLDWRPALRAPSLAALRGGARRPRPLRPPRARDPPAARSPGRGGVFGIFLIGYALARIALEGFRQADAQFVTPDNPHGHVLAFGADSG